MTEAGASRRTIAPATPSSTRGPGGAAPDEPLPARSSDAPLPEAGRELPGAGFVLGLGAAEHESAGPAPGPRGYRRL
jgi:hypothetical protein